MPACLDISMSMEKEIYESGEDENDAAGAREADIL